MTSKEMKGPSGLLIRDEIAADIPAISRTITEAMRLLAQASGTEAAIVDLLRADKALALSLVATLKGQVIGHLAASAASVGGQDGWGLIGPLAVAPDWHRQGVGSVLMAEALRRLRATCRGAVLVGSPAYYNRFGFAAFPGLGAAGCPPEVVLALPFHGRARPVGEVTYHPAFALDQPD